MTQRLSLPRYSPIERRVNGLSKRLETTRDPETRRIVREALERAVDDRDEASRLLSTASDYNGNVHEAAQLEERYGRRGYRYFT